MSADMLGLILGVLGLIIGVVGIALAIYFYRKTIRAKVLAYAYTQPVSLRLPIYNVPSDYSDLADEPSRVFMLLWNRGTAPIEKSDFVEPIKILPTEHILRIASHEKDSGVIATIDEAAKSISIDLLRPGEAIIFLIDSKKADYKADASIQMKSADMSVSLRSAPIQAPHVIAGVAAVATVVATSLAGFLIWQLVALGTGAAGTAINTAAGFVIGVSGWAIAGRVFKWAYDRFAWLTPFIPTKFFRLQNECSDINRLWSSLRKQSRGLMAAG
jgi:hypothetical protein